jgi:exosortase
MREGALLETHVGFKDVRQRRLVLLLALLVLWLFAFLPTWRAWLRLCLSDPQYEHGPIVAVVGALLVGHRLLGLPQGVIAPRPAHAAFLFLVVVAWAIGWLAGISALQQVLVVIAGLTIVMAVLGRSAAANVVLPLMILLTASEAWEHAAAPLQSLTAMVVGSTLPWFDVPAVVEGNRVAVPAGEFVIEQGCAGIKYIMVMLAIAILIVTLNNLNARVRVLLVVFAIVLALVANWVRVGIVIYVGQVTQLRHPWVHDHYMLGWVLFGLFLIPLIIATRRIADRGQSARSAAEVVPLIIARPAGSALRTATVTALLLGPLIWIFVIVSAPDAGGGPSPPRFVAGEDALHMPRAAVREAGTPPVSLWRYESGNTPIQLARMIVRPPLRADGVTLLRGVISGPDESVTIGESTGSLRGGDKHEIRFAERLIYSPKHGRRLTRWWFEVGASTFDRSAWAKAALLSKISRGKVEMTITMLEIACQPDCVSAASTLDGFMGRLALRAGEES